MDIRARRIVMAVAVMIACGVESASTAQPQPQPGQRRSESASREGPSRVLDLQGVRRDTSTTKYALPSMRLPNFGVKSSAPRGIGRKGGSLLPPPVDAPPPRAAAVRLPSVRAGGSDDVWGGRLTRGADGTVRVVPGRVPSGPMVDPHVLASGDYGAIAQMLRPAIDYSFLTQFQRWQLWGVNPCGAPSYFETIPDPFTFSTDTYVSMDNYVVDSGGVDPFVAGGTAALAGATPIVIEDPEAGLTAFERAGNRLYDGKPDEAVVLLRSYVDAHPDEPEAVRALALALLDARRTREGVELMGEVYERTPALAASPIPPDSVGPEREMRDLVLRVVEFGHKHDTSAAWLTAAVLMQAERRPEPALKMIERAEGRLLAPEVVRAMRAALRP